MKKFQDDVASGNHEAQGWSNSNYGISKLGLIAYTLLLARENPALRVRFTRRSSVILDAIIILSMMTAKDVRVSRLDRVTAFTAPRH